MKNISMLLTCEHGGNKIPARYQKLFSGRQNLLKTHRGLDIGALKVAKLISKKLKVNLIGSETSRLLVDLNRSHGHKDQFSEVTSGLPAPEKTRILKKYYFPHHVRVQNQVNQLLHSDHDVIHLGIHSFTPVMRGVARNADIGILYDPRSSTEKRFSKLLKLEIEKLAPEFKVRMNYPYRGTSDGLTQALRKAFNKSHYAGIEIELNQKFFAKNQNHNKLANLLLESIQNAKESMR